MGKKLFVGNLPWSVNWQALKDIFSEYGEVVFARVIRDRDTGRSKGFGFVEFASEEDAAKAKDALNEAEVDGRKIRVDYAVERQPQWEEGQSQEDQAGEE